MRLFFYLFIVLSISTFLQAQTAGGDIDITAGDGSDTGGSVNITSGDGAWNAGNVNITSGVSSDKSGDVNITTATGNTVGNINIRTLSSNGIAGHILIESGLSNAGTGGITLKTCSSLSSGSDINLICGPTMEGSDINLTAGDGDNGGNINLTPGIGNPFNDGLVVVNGSGTYSGSWTLVSDKRYKEDIKNLEDALSNVIQLQGVTYKWKKDEYPVNNFSARKQIEEFVDFYNIKRLHSSLFYLTPEDFLMNRTDEKINIRIAKLQSAKIKRYQVKNVN